MKYRFMHVWLVVAIEDILMTARAIVSLGVHHCLPLTDCKVTSCNGTRGLIAKDNLSGTSCRRDHLYCI